MFLKFWNWFWTGRVFFGVLDIAIFIIILLIVLFFIARKHIWWPLGYWIAVKKYNKGRCNEAGKRGCGCGCGDPHRHHNEFKEYGPLTLSRKFVRKHICEHF